jgi:hypothetical protein
MGGIGRAGLGGGAWKHPCRIARRPDVRFYRPGLNDVDGPIGASGAAKQIRFGAYYRIRFLSQCGDHQNPRSKPLPDTTGMLSKIPRFSAILGVGLRTLANCHCDAKIPMAIG